MIGIKGKGDQVYIFRLNNIIYLLSYTVFDTQTKYILIINTNYITYSNTYGKNTLDIL